ncbi:hypothetical protein [Streptomyces microflavus]
MHSDLADSCAALKDIFARRGIPTTFAKAPSETINQLREKLHIPAYYRSFLSDADPVDVETVTPVERIRLFPSDKLLSEQPDRNSDQGSDAATWPKTRIVIARSSLSGDPYFLDTAKVDTKDDSPVFACATTNATEAVLCASGFPQFLRILAVSMEVASGFGESGLDDDDEAIFREALAAKIKNIDSAALRAGHWT